MIKNYLVITFRNFLRNRNYALLNVVGLSIGVTACLIIYLLISYDLSFDKFHSRYERIHRVVGESYAASGTEYASTVPYPLTAAFRDDLPEIPLITGVHYEDEVLVKVGAEKQRVTNVVFADSLFFEVFDFEVVSGNPRVDLGEPNKVFLTRSLADKIMAGKEHLTIRIDNQLELEVAGIIADPPPTSHINFTMVVSYPSLTKEFLNGFDISEWGITVRGFTYFVRPDNMSSETVDARLQAMLTKHSPEGAKKSRYRTQSLSDVHFSERYTANPGDRPNGVKTNIYALGIVGMFILVMACINFVNLATALAVKKSKEIGVRKTLGARRAQLGYYFLSETFIIVLIAVLASLCATEWLLIWINNFTDKHIELNLTGDPGLITFIVVLLIGATGLSGFYPAIVLSGYDPVVVLKNRMAVQGASAVNIRKVLVIFQFTISQILMISTLIVANQMDFFMNKALGFRRDAIINVPVPENKPEILESMRTRLQAVAGVEQVSFALGGPTADNHFGTGGYLTSAGKDSEVEINLKLVDRAYMNVYGLKLKSGHWFTETEERMVKDLDQRTGFVYVVNESFARKTGLTPDEILGKMITTGLANVSAEVVGVVEDFHEQSLHQEIAPLVMTNCSMFYYDAGIRINGNNVNETIAQMQRVYQETFPEYEFRYEFLDDYLNRLYRQDRHTFTLFKIFAGISVLISCLGLYGLISFIATQRVKEVGIRKVLGASFASIVVLFGKEFVKLIAVAFLIASPVAWYFMRDWLNDFAYRVPIRGIEFVIGVAATLLIAITTVAYRSVRAAVSNPVDALRSE